MKANSFMIGNYVLDKEDRSDLSIFEIVKLECEIYTDYNSGDEYSITAKKINTQNHYYDLIPFGIHLTEKWLLDLGFKQNKLVFSLTNDEYTITIFFCDLWQFQYESSIESANLVNDFKVHELQNLYYSLTGRFLQLVG